MKIAQRVACVSPSPPRMIYDRAAQYTDVVDLTLGDPDLPPPLAVREAACRAILAGKTRYSANAGLLELRRAIAQDMKAKNGIDVDPRSEVLVTVGAMEAAFLSLYTLVEPGDEVVIHAPFWINYAQVVRSLGAVPVFVYTRPEENFQLKTKDLASVLTGRTRCVILNSPNNPTGAIIPEATLAEIAELAQKRDFIVLSDEIYDSLVYDGGKSCSIGAFPGMKERTVVINGLSKRFAMTGYRLGWAAAPAELISQMTKMQENIVACAPLPAQHAGIEALTHHSGTNQIRNEFQKRRDLVIAGVGAIRGLKCHPVPATFYAMIDISQTGLPAQEFAYRLLDEQKVAVVHGSAYGGERYDNLIRIAFTMESEKLQEALRRLRTFVESLPGKEAKQE